MFTVCPNHMVKRGMTFFSYELLPKYTLYAITCGLDEIYMHLYYMLNVVYNIYTYVYTFFLGVRV